MKQAEQKGEENGTFLVVQWLRLHASRGGGLVQSLGWEDALEKGKPTHTNLLAWRIPWIIWLMG